MRSLSSPKNYHRCSGHELPTAVVPMDKQFETNTFEGGGKMLLLLSYTQSHLILCDENSKVQGKWSMLAAKWDRDANSLGCTRRKGVETKLSFKYFSFKNEMQIMK